MAKLSITQVRSRIGESPVQRANLRSLGLKRIGHTVVKEDTPQVRGYLKVVTHLVRVEEAD